MAFKQKWLNQVIATINQFNFFHILFFEETMKGKLISYLGGSRMGPQHVNIIEKLPNLK